MRQPRLAARYAKCLMDIAREQNLIEEICKDVRLIAAAIEHSLELRLFLKQPIIKAHKKIEILDIIFGSLVSNLTGSFIKLIVRKVREPVLPEICQSFIAMYNVEKGIVPVKLTIAAPVESNLLDSIEIKIKNETGCSHIELKTEINEDIIGGFIIEYNNKLLDASILSKLNNIRKRF